MGITASFDGNTTFSVIESFGAIKVVRDAAYKIYIQIGNNTPVAVKLGGTQIVQGGFSGWETLGAETVAGVNQVMWKNTTTNTLSLWTLDSNWNWTASTGNWGLNSAEAMQQEINFQQDFNGDGNIGAGVTVTLSLSPDKVLEDGAANLVYTFTRTGSLSAPLTVTYTVAGTATLGTDYTGIALTPASKSITFAAGSATATLIVDPTADGELEPDETVALTLQSGTGYGVGTAGAVVGTIQNDESGGGFQVIESAGATKLVKDGQNKLFSQVGNGTPIAVKYGGTQIVQGAFSGWETLGVETVAGVNQAMWKNAATNLLSLWRLDNNWNWTASTGNWGLNSAEAMQQEINFQQDFNGDGNIGARPVIGLSIASGNVTEDGAAHLIYTFTRSGLTNNGLTVTYSVAGTATPGTDYSGIPTTPGNKTLTFAAGSATATLTVDPNADAEIEPDETVELTLVAGTGYTIGTPATVVGTIANDDVVLVTAALSPAVVAEDGSQNLIYTFTRTGPTDGQLTVYYTIAGTATPGADYSGIAAEETIRSIVFNAGSSTAALILDPMADGDMEPDETVILNLVGSADYSLLGPTSVLSGIISNDDFPVITLTNNPQLVEEDGTGHLVFAFNRTGPISGALTVSFTLAGTALLGTDYTGVTEDEPKQITFAAGLSIATLRLIPTADTLVEPDESVILTLAPGSGYTIGTTASTAGTIVNDDPRVSLSCSPSAVWEDGPNNLIYTFTRSGPADMPLTVNYTVGGSATLGKDYGGISSEGTIKSVTFSAGSSTTSIAVDPIADLEIEANETVLLSLAPGTGYTIQPGSAVSGTISNDDDPIITLSVSPVAVKEDGAASLIYTFHRTGATSTPLYVDYILGGTATLTEDYFGFQTSPERIILTFPAGSSTASVTVSPEDDVKIEEDETVTLTLQPRLGYIIGTTAPVVGTILNDDFPAISISLVPRVVSEDGDGNLAFIFTRTGPVLKPLTINYTVSGTASLGIDYSGIPLDGTVKQITFSANSATAIVTVDPNTDTIFEYDESVGISLSPGTGYTFGPITSVTGTISNDDLPRVTLAVSPATVTEDGTSNLIYTFTRNGPTNSPLSVTYTVGGTATLGSDYTGIATAGSTKTITFAEGASTALVTVDPRWDLAMEPNETVNLTLAPGASYSIGTTTSVSGTIRNDDTALTLYNATSSSLPNQQGWLAFGTGFTGSQTRTASGVRLNSTALLADAAGYSTMQSSSPTLVNSAFPALDRSVGFALDFRLQVLSESHQSELRAGFAVVLLDQGPTPQGIELGFWSNSIFSQAGGSTAFQASAERNDGINTTVATNYNLRILDQNYYLLANNKVVLTGSLQDYSQWQKNPLLPYNPYTTPNFLFLGDNSSSASASVELGSITLGVPVAGDVDDDVLTGTGIGESFNGQQGADLIRGNGGHDWLAGGDGNDTLHGGSGDDLLIGGRGADRFLFQWSAPLDGNPLGVDTLMDFNPAEDRLVLARNTFASLPPDPLLPASAFAVVNSDGDAALSTAVIVYNRINGGLFYNPNGAAPGFANTQPNGLFAQLWGGSNGGPTPILSGGMLDLV